MGVLFFPLPAGERVATTALSGGSRVRGAGSCDGRIGERRTQPVSPLKNGISRSFLAQLDARHITIRELIACVALPPIRKYFVDVLPPIQDSHDFGNVIRHAIEQYMRLGSKRSDSRSQLVARASGERMASTVATS
jgi:hypothetical protein